MKTVESRHNFELTESYRMDLLLNKCVQLLRPIDLNMCDKPEGERYIEVLKVIVGGSHD